MIQQSEIGKYLKTIREKLKITQWDLEERLMLSEGSLTKLESGKVIPKRETLLKIIEILELSPFESLQLLGLPSTKLTDIVDFINEIILLEDEIEICQKAVNEIPKKLGLLGASMHLVNNDILRVIAFTKAWYTDFIIQAMPLYYRDFFVSLKNNPDNYLVKSLVEKKTFYETDLYLFTKPIIPKKYSNLLTKIANIKSILSVPMYSNNIRIGVVIYVKSDKMGFEYEIPLLESLTNSISNRILTLRK